jgi:hypothetical protein
VLDAIVWAFGGNKHKPSKPKRDDSFAEPTIVVELDNGVVVRREGKNAALKVLDRTWQQSWSSVAGRIDQPTGIRSSTIPEFVRKRKGRDRYCR